MGSLLCFPIGFPITGADMTMLGSTGTHFYGGTRMQTVRTTKITIKLHNIVKKTLGKSIKSATKQNAFDCFGFPSCQLNRVLEKQIILSDQGVRKLKVKFNYVINCLIFRKLQSMT